MAHKRKAPFPPSAEVMEAGRSMIAAADLAKVRRMVERYARFMADVVEPEEMPTDADKFVALINMLGAEMLVVLGTIDDVEQRRAVITCSLGVVTHMFTCIVSDHT